tara:strand:+ start:597 stop:1148 length:552 start_codon:yes stop_codon:yes gene_type:complete
MKYDILHNKSCPVVHTLTFLKTITFPINNCTELFIDEYINTLKEIQQQDFNRIKIPQFIFQQKNNSVILEIEFIKGIRLDSLSTDARNEWYYPILQDMVYRENVPHVQFNVDLTKDTPNLIDGTYITTFCDFNPSNFIINCEFANSNKSELYYVDIDGFQYANHEKKKLFFLFNEQFKNFQNI